MLESVKVTGAAEDYLNLIAKHVWRQNKCIYCLWVASS